MNAAELMQQCNPEEMDVHELSEITQRISDNPRAYSHLFDELNRIRNLLNGAQNVETRA